MYTYMCTYAGWLARQVIRNNFSIDDCPSLGELFRGGGDDSDVNVGYIRQCYFNQMFEWVQQYDVYRYTYTHTS